MILRACILLCLLGTSTASAAEMRSIDVDFVDGHYTVESIVWFDARVDQTFAVFSNWETSTRFSDAIEEARDLGPYADGTRGYYVRNKACFLFFCKTVVREGSVESQHDSLLRASADPELSDFKFSEETWEFSEEDGGTRVRYVLDMEPDFWVPPAIGPYMIKRKLASKGSQAIDRIEALAQQQ